MYYIIYNSNKIFHICTNFSFTEGQNQRNSRGDIYMCTLLHYQAKVITLSGKMSLLHYRLEIITLSVSKFITLSVDVITLSGVIISLFNHILE